MAHHLQLTAELEAHLDKMRTEAEEVNQSTDDPAIRHRSLYPDSAAFLSILARTMGAKRILEIGTSVGYSTIYLADAVRQTGGHITSVELLPEKSERARQNLQATGLSEYVALRVGDVREIFGTLQGPWDLLFIDLEKELYLPVWRMLSSEVRIGGIVVSDNVVSHGDELKEYLDTIANDRRFETVTLPIGLGIELSRRLR